MALVVVVYFVVLLFILIFVHPKPSQNNNISGVTEATVYYDNGKYRCEVGKYDQHGVAFGKYKNTFLETGWDILELKMNDDKLKKYNEEEKFYAFGMLESCLSHSRISTHFINMKSWMLKRYGGKIPSFMHDFYTNQKDYTEEMIKKNPHDEFWKMVNNLMFQLSGMIDEYNTKEGTNVSYVDFQTMNSFGDMFTLQNLGPKELRPKRRTTHCTAAIKLKYDLSDIFVGHNTWFHYPGMTRIFKTYEYNQNTISMSSYPGTLCSQDDFYVTDKLYIMETSFEVYNSKLFEKITPNSVFTWQRSMVATILSSSGKEWTDLFSKYNSGTYNNMWMLIDYSLFEPYKRLKKGLFTVLEQLPGFIKTEDITEVLNLQYFPSYNSPFFQETFDLSGYDTLTNQTDDFYIWGAQTAIRFKMIMRDISQVESLDDFKMMMRYSQWKEDFLSRGDPGYTIAPRFDIRKTKEGCWGNFDAKVTSIQNLKKEKGNRRVEIIGGPPNNEFDVPVFDWSSSEACKDYTHAGMPDKWDFDWVFVEI